MTLNLAHYLLGRRSLADALAFANDDAILGDPGNDQPPALVPLYLPARQKPYVLDRPAVVGPLAAEHAWSKVCLASDGAEIVYTGPQDGTPALTLSGSQRATGGGWRLSDPRAANGSRQWGESVGLAIGAPWAANGGTVSTGLTLDAVTVAGFALGVSVGMPGGRAAASEVTLRRLDTQYCSTGSRLTGWNTLNVHFESPDFFGCDIGIDGGECSAWSVSGRGSSAGCGLDFDVGTGGTVRIEGFRSEGPVRLLRARPSAPLGLTMANCIVTEHVGGDGFLVETGGGALLTLEGCSLMGRVGLTSPVVWPGGRPLPAAALTLRGCHLRGPGPYAPLPGHDLAGFRVRVEGCTEMGAGPNDVPGLFADAAGVLA